jgi:hypothetical protein
MVRRCGWIRTFVETEDEADDSFVDHPGRSARRFRRGTARTPVRAPAPAAVVTFGLTSEREPTDEMETKR